MAKKYLDDIGLSHFFDKLKLLFATKDTATQSVDGLMSSSDKMKLDGLDQLVESATGESVTASDSSFLESLIVYGKSVQDGTPTPSSPVEIQVVQAPNGGTFGISVNGTVTPINLQGNVLASLPDGTCDVLSVDAVGHVTLEKRVQRLYFDGSSSSGWSVGGNYASSGGGYWLYGNSLGDNTKTVNGIALSDKLTYHDTGNSRNLSGLTCYGNRFANLRIHPFTPSGQMTVAQLMTWLQSNPLEFYGLYATPQKIDLGYIDMPDIPSGSQVSITASIVPTIEVSWWTKYAESIARAIASIKNIVI